MLRRKGKEMTAMKKLNLLWVLALFFALCALTSTIYMIYKNEVSITPLIIMGLCFLSACIPYILVLEIDRKQLGIVFFYYPKKKEG